MQAVHCEYFGGSINTGVKNRTGNSLYKGQLLSAALIAVIQVRERLD